MTSIQGSHGVSKRSEAAAGLDEIPLKKRKLWEYENKGKHVVLEKLNIKISVQRNTRK